MENLRELLNVVAAGRGGSIGMAALIDGVDPSLEAAPFSVGKATSGGINVEALVAARL